MLRFIRSGVYSISVCDRPDCDVIATTRIRGTIPVTALTSDVKYRMRAIQEGYQLHLSKPIEAGKLATVVASLVGRT
ncbi:hypothetical protein [Nostoc sp.]|uniref:hypothetical protein n=1 Tax=Nostoc sp. TaxID=1180 RepID=UPI002FF5AD8B